MNLLILLALLLVLLLMPQVIRFLMEAPQPKERPQKRKSRPVKFDGG